MAHSHSHADAHGETESTYFLDQLCTVAVGGLLGFTAIMAYQTGMLTRIRLIERFHLPVLVGGVALLVMVVIRAAAIWGMAGRFRAAAENGAAKEPAHDECDHQHAPGEPCEHDHHHGHGHAHPHGHEHSHGHDHSHAHSHSHSHSHDHAHGGDDDAHDHGWAPWRYAILIIPAVLYFLGLPTEGVNRARLDKDLEEEKLDPGTMSRRLAMANLGGSVVLGYYKKSGKPVPLRFSELAVHASRQKAREYFEGRTVILRGQLSMLPGKDNEFSLYRVKVNCCGADAVTLKARIVAPQPIQGFNRDDWVRIEGEISFQQIAGRNERLPVIQLPSMDNLQRIDPPANQNDDV